MPPKKDNLPINVEVDLDNGGSISYASEVIAIIAGVAANEIDGLAGMCTSGGIGDIIGRNRNITRGVRVEIGTEEASVDLYVIIEYGFPIQKVCSEVQENVRKAIESMTGLHVVRVDVHVQGVSFEKEKQEQKAGLDAAHTAMLETPIAEKISKEESKKQEVKDEESNKQTAKEEASTQVPQTEDVPLETENADQKEEQEGAKVQHKKGKKA